MSSKIKQEDIDNSEIDVEAELARILKENIMLEFFKIGITQEDIDRPMIEAIIELAKIKN